MRAAWEWRRGGALCLPPKRGEGVSPDSCLPEPSPSHLCRQPSSAQRPLHPHTGRSPGLPLGDPHSSGSSPHPLKLDGLSSWAAPTAPAPGLGLRVAVRAMGWGHWTKVEQNVQLPGGSRVPSLASTTHVPSSGIPGPCSSASTPQLGEWMFKAKGLQCHCQERANQRGGGAQCSCLASAPSPSDQGGNSLPNPMDIPGWGGSERSKMPKEGWGVGHAKGSSQAVIEEPLS